MKFAEMLLKMGFKNMTHILWKHTYFGIIAFKENSTCEDIAIQIFEAGQNRKIAEIKSVLEL